MVSRRIGLLLLWLYAGACTSAAALDEHEEPPAAPTGPKKAPDPWRIARAPAFEPCIGVAGEVDIDVEHLGPVETSSIVLDRIAYETNWRSHERPVALRRATLTYPTPGYIVYAVRFEDVDNSRLSHCVVPETIEDHGFRDMVACWSYSDALLNASVANEPEFTGLLDGAPRIYTDLDALAACAPQVADAVARDPEAPWGVRFVEQLASSDGRQRWVLVEVDLHRHRRTELLSFDGRPS